METVNFEEIVTETQRISQDWPLEEIKELINTHRKNIVFSKACISGLVINLREKTKNVKPKK